LSERGSALPPFLKRKAWGKIQAGKRKWKSINHPGKVQEAGTDAAHHPTRKRQASFIFHFYSIKGGHQRVKRLRSPKMHQEEETPYYPPICSKKRSYGKKKKSCSSIFLSWGEGGILLHLFLIKKV